MVCLSNNLLNLGNQTVKYNQKHKYMELNAENNILLQLILKLTMKMAIESALNVEIIGRL